MSATAMSIWRAHAQEILQVSTRLSESGNKTVEYQAWVKQLFGWTTTHRLLKSIETLALPHNNPLALDTIHDILQRKWNSSVFNSSTSNSTASPPLEIAVMGGSLTAGHGCLDNPLGIRSQSFLKRQLPCAWPSRLQDLFDMLLPQPGLIRITNMAMAATTSNVGATVVDYNLWPPHLLPHGPDIVIAAFSTNDALAEAPPSVIYQNMQQLIQSIVTKQQDCRYQSRKHLPLLIYVDDFIAWPGPVMKWLDFHDKLHELADWYQIGLVSYANAFRDVVHADLLREQTFKGEWTYQEKKKNFVSNPHPGMSFHIVMSWVVAYYILHNVVVACDFMVSEQHEGNEEKDRKIFNSDQRDNNDTLSTVVAGISVPSIARPALTESLLTEAIPAEWNKMKQNQQAKCLTTNNENEDDDDALPCAFVWVANRVSQFRTADAIEQFLRPHLIDNIGWKAEGNSYRSKHGWVAKQAGATFELQIPPVANFISYITILALVSYGKDWQDCRIQMTVWSFEKENNEERAHDHKNETMTIDGFHNSKTSVIIPHKFALKRRISRGETVRVRIELTGGSNFKITGMAFCQH